MAASALHTTQTVRIFTIHNIIDFAAHWLLATTACIEWLCRTQSQTHSNEMRIDAGITITITRRPQTRLLQQSHSTHFKLKEVLNYLFIQLSFESVAECAQRTPHRWEFIFIKIRIFMFDFIFVSSKENKDIKWLVCECARACRTHKYCEKNYVDDATATTAKGGEKINKLCVRCGVTVNIPPSSGRQRMQKIVKILNLFTRTIYQLELVAVEVSSMLSLDCSDCKRATSHRPNLYLADSTVVGLPVECRHAGFVVAAV